MSFTHQPLSTPVAPADTIKTSRPSCNVYSYDDTNGFRIVDPTEPQISSVGSAKTYAGPLRNAYRKAPQLSIPPSLPENGIPIHRSPNSAVASDPGSYPDKPEPKGPLNSHKPKFLFGGLLQHRVDTSTSARPVTPPPGLAPGIAFDHSTPNISPSISPSHSIASRKCTCPNPEPIVARPMSAVSANGSPSRRPRLRLHLTPSSQKRSPSVSSTHCVCKWAPVVQDAKLVPMAQTSGPRKVSISQPGGGSPLTALPTPPDASWVGTAGGDAAPEIPPRSPSRWKRLGTVFEVPGRESGSTAGGANSNSQRGSGASGEKSDAENRGSGSTARHRAAALADLEGASADSFLPFWSPARRLRRSLFRWSLVRLAANVVLFVALLCVALLLVWPAVEGARFPGVNYAHDGSIGRQLVTVPVPAALAAKWDQAVGEAAGSVGSSSMLPATTTGTGADEKITTLTIPYSPESPLSSSPFIRTLHAEFRAGGFPALVLGLALMHLVTMLMTALSACSLKVSLRRKDELRGNGEYTHPPDRDITGDCIFERTLSGCYQWLRGIEWSGHHAHCVTAKRFKAFGAVLRAVYVVLVLTVMAAVAAGKVSAGRGL